MFKKSTLEDERLNNADERANRLSADRAVTENREVTDAQRRAERFSMLRDVNTLLPVPPELPGYHLCWLTTTNNKDTLEHRYRLGYSLVKPEELPGFKLDSQKSGEATSDRIMVNEMVLAKIAHDTWIEHMTYLHHDLPQETMKNLRDSVRIGQDGRGRSVAYSGGDFKEGVSDGYNSLVSNKVPTFAGIN
jgi:hypothetical protein